MGLRAHPTISRTSNVREIPSWKAISHNSASSSAQASQPGRRLAALGVGNVAGNFLAGARATRRPLPARTAPALHRHRNSRKRWGFSRSSSRWSADVRRLKTQLEPSSLRPGRPATSRGAPGGFPVPSEDDKMAEKKPPRGGAQRVRLGSFAASTSRPLSNQIFWLVVAPCGR